MNYKFNDYIQYILNDSTYIFQEKMIQLFSL